MLCMDPVRDDNMARICSWTGSLCTRTGSAELRTMSRAIWTISSCAPSLESQSWYVLEGNRNSCTSSVSQKKGRSSLDTTSKLLNRCTCLQYCIHNNIIISIKNFVFLKFVAQPSYETFATMKIFRIAVCHGLSPSGPPGESLSFSHKPLLHVLVLCRASACVLLA